MFRPLRLVSLLLTLSVFGIGGWRVFSAASGAATVNSALRESQLPGNSPDSYFRSVNLSAALREIRAQAGPRAAFLNLDIFPGYVTADVSTGSETSGHWYKVGLDRQIHLVPLTLTGPGSVANSSFSGTQIDPGTPQSLIAQLGRTHNVSLGAVSHVVATVNPATGKAGWSVYPADGSTHYEAALNGSGLVDPAAAAISAARSTIANLPTAATTVPKASGLAACLINAAGDVQRIQACTAR